MKPYIGNKSFYQYISSNNVFNEHETQYNYSIQLRKVVTNTLYFTLLSPSPSGYPTLLHPGDALEFSRKTSQRAPPRETQSAELGGRGPPNGRWGNFEGRYIRISHTGLHTQQSSLKVMTYQYIQIVYHSNTPINNVSICRRIQATG